MKYANFDSNNVFFNILIGGIHHIPDSAVSITSDQEAALLNDRDGIWKLINGEIVKTPLPSPEPIPEPEPVTILAPRDYLKRFTFEEYAAARTGSIAVQYSLDNLIAAQYIDLNDPEVAQGLDLMVAEGVISAERKEQLLEPL